MSLNEKAVIASTAEDHHSQAAYTGKVTQRERVTFVDDRGLTHEKDIDIYISWDSIAAILKLIRKRIGIK